MFATFEEKREFILGKYHGECFDGNRMKRHDIRFDEQTGMDGEEIKRRILENDEKIEELSHPVRKAKAFAFVLENTRISCDPKDPFPAINAIDRPLNATIVAKWNLEVFQQIIPEVANRRASFERQGVITMWPDYDHSVPVWERLFLLGFSGVLEESERVRKSRFLTKEQDEFFEGIRITYQAIIAFIGRLTALAEKTAGSEKLAQALRHIQHNPPKTFYQALLLNYIYFMLSEHIEGLQVRSLGNFDRLYFPFYQNDLASGIAREELKEYLACFFLQFTAIGNYWNQPVFLGGEKENGETEINELSYFFLETYDELSIYNPKIQIKVSSSTPTPFLLKALDMIRRGKNSIVFVSDETMRKALVKKGATQEQARLCNVKGCYEYSVQGGMETGMNYFNMIKPLEYALHEGKDGVTGAFCGRKSPPISAYKTFDDLYAEYKKQFLYWVEQAIETVNAYEDYLAYINPQSMLSATYPTCLEKGKDALGGGSVINDATISFGFLANIADSFTMIKKYVYDKQTISLEELVKMLDNNYEGAENWRLILLSDKDKYGNDKDLPDFFARDIVSLAVQSVNDKKSSFVRDGNWLCGFHIARMSYEQGSRTAATPDGRRRGEELSKNCSAALGQNKEGATAAILSITKIDASEFIGDAALDLGLLPSAVKGEDGLNAMYGLLKTFIKRGGHALQINVFNADVLKDAQAHPEKYQDLQIRVSGWNVLWNNINKKEQEGFIKQAESLM